MLYSSWKGHQGIEAGLLYLNMIPDDTLVGLCFLFLQLWILQVGSLGCQEDTTLDYKLWLPPEYLGLIVPRKQMNI